MDRRSFFKISAGGALSLALPWNGLAGPVREKPYSVVILGDTRYDAMDPEKYHAGYSLENKKRAESGVTPLPLALFTAFARHRSIPAKRL